MKNRVVPVLTFESIILDIKKLEALSQRLVTHIKGAQARLLRLQIEPSDGAADECKKKSLAGQK